MKKAQISLSFFLKCITDNRLKYYFNNSLAITSF
jgi:hypothetical protein